MQVNLLTKALPYVAVTHGTRKYCLSSTIVFLVGVVPTIVIAHYVLRISRCLDFLSPMLTNTGIFLRGLKLARS